VRVQSPPPASWGHLARALARCGYHVRGCPFEAGRSENAGIEPDRHVAGCAPRAAAGVDVVYHVAAVYREAGIPASTYRAVNATAVGDVIHAAASAGARRVVHCSTVGVHGDVEHPPANEDAPLKPGDIYQVTKLEGERIARDAAATTGVP
jgi:nucleoside-diphosphate-sugar epimerase